MKKHHRSAYICGKTNSLKCGRKCAPISSLWRPARVLTMNNWTLDTDLYNIELHLATNTTTNTTNDDCVPDARLGYYAPLILVGGALALCGVATNALLIWDPIFITVAAFESRQYCVCTAKAHL
ncbi:MAG: hypothetical protein GY820_47705 [Gammaproteobacteria bacterium]|nr:hypothetical protein [Gammaproteobacteria bacterium]